jgi:protein-S-isoprenylcysteine O-methyltransferase Ste14
MKLITVVIGASFLSTAFVLAPIGMIILNDARGWPRCQTEFGRIIGGGLILAGIVAVLYCSNLFARIGKGTPVPVEPPKHLVITGLYRYSRNPIYVADVAILLGLFLFRGELLLLMYVVIFAAVIHIWVVCLEEPVLRDRFGKEYIRYKQTVPRWLSLRRSGSVPRDLKD